MYWGFHAFLFCICIYVCICICISYNSFIFGFLLSPPSSCLQGPATVPPVGWKQPSRLGLSLVYTHSVCFCIYTINSWVEEGIKLTSWVRKSNLILHSHPHRFFLQCFSIRILYSIFSQFLGYTYWRTIYHNISHAKQLTNHNLWEYLPSLICSHFRKSKKH